MTSRRTGLETETELRVEDDVCADTAGLEDVSLDWLLGATITSRLTGLEGSIVRARFCEEETRSVRPGCGLERTSWLGASLRDTDLGLSVPEDRETDLDSLAGAELCRGAAGVEGCCLPTDWDCCWESERPPPPPRAGRPNDNATAFKRINMINQNIHFQCSL